MRNFIFKNELEYILSKHGDVNKQEQHKIKELLLTNASVTDRGKIYFLKAFPPNWIDEIKKITKSTDFIAELNDTLSLDDDLLIPFGLKQKILDNEKVAVFVGAGVSKLLGYPLWGELGEKAIEFLREKGQIDDFQSSRIIREVKDPKQQLSILENFFEKGSQELNAFYTRELRKVKEVDPLYVNPYEILVDPVFGWIKLTSNVDLEFSTSLKNLINRSSGTTSPQDSTTTPKTIANEEDLIVTQNFSMKSLELEKIYHIHGVVTQPTSLIFTTLDYISTYYRKDNNPTHDFLQAIFSDYTVLFIGYGLEELQILESIVNNNSMGAPKKKQRHYALFGAYLNELNFFNIRKEYFSKSLNIELQHYYLDVEKYKRLAHVLQKWREEIAKARGSSFHKTVDFIENVLGHGANR